MNEAKQPSPSGGWPGKRAPIRGAERSIKLPPTIFRYVLETSGMGMADGDRDR